MVATAELALFKIFFRQLNSFQDFLDNSTVAPAKASDEAVFTKADKNFQSLIISQELLRDFIDFSNLTLWYKQPYTYEDQPYTYGENSVNSDQKHGLSN